MARQLFNLPTASVTGGIINITKYKDSTRKSISASSGATGRSALVNNFTFTKLKNNADSYILVTGIIGGMGMPNYPHIGMCCTIDQIGYGQTGQPSEAPNHPQGPAGGGIYYCGINVVNEGTTFIIHKSCKEFILNAGSHRLDIGWNANSDVRPCEYINPNSIDNDRHQQCATHILVYEIAR